MALIMEGSLCAPRMKSASVIFPSPFCEVCVRVRVLDVCVHVCSYVASYAAHAGLSSFEDIVFEAGVCVVVKVERKYNNAVQSTETLPNIS